MPPRLPRPPAGRTRASKFAYESWHPHKFQNVLPHRSLDNARRAFPFCAIDDWNSLPAWFFDGGFDFKNLQTFKIRVHNFLGGKSVLNPALVRLRKRGRGGDRGHERLQSVENDEATTAGIAALGRMVDWGINHSRSHAAS